MEENLKNLNERALKEYNLGNIEIARSLFEKIISIDKESFQTMYNLGIIHFHNKEYSDAEKYLVSAHKLNQSEKYFLSVVDIYLIQNFIKEAENFINTNKKSYKKNIIAKAETKVLRQTKLMKLVEAYNSVDNKNITEKIILFENYVDNYKKDSIGWKLLGSMHLKLAENDENSYDIEKNIDAFERSYKLNDKDIDVILALGSLYHQKKEYEKGLGLYSVSKKYYPNEASLYFNSANMYVTLNELDNAKKELHKALEISPNTYNYLQNLAKVYKDLNDNKNSYILYERMIKLEPEKAIGYRGLGAINLIFGNLKEAQDLIEKSLELDPGNVDASQNLSICNFRMGKNNKGMQLMKKHAGVISFTTDKNEGSFEIKE